MKKITFLGLFLFSCVFMDAQACFIKSARGISEAKIYAKAKAEGVTRKEYPAYSKRERVKLENHHNNPQKTFSGPYSQLPGQQAARTMSGSACANLDFENFNFGNWGIFNGINANSVLSPSAVVVDPTPYTSGQNGPSGVHVIVDSANSVDFLFNNLSLVSNYSGKTIARLNDNSLGGKASILERQYQVTSNQPSLNFSYAVLLEDAGHSYADQPYLNIVVFDSTGAAIPSTSLSIVASNSVNIGFTMVGPGNNFFYKAWTPVNLNLSAYIGQTVTFQAIVADCVLGGHGAHGYIDFDCGGPLAGVANVWPGDANYDLSVDYLDLFYVGAGFAQTGSSRVSQGNTWAAAPSNNWNAYSLYLVDSKHADCDGSGTIGFPDTTAISLNYGLGHAFKPGSTQSTTQNTGAPENITLFPSDNTIYAGQPFSIDFSIGTTSDLVDSIYAIGLSMDFPDQYLDNSQSIMDCSTSIIDNTSGGHLNLFKSGSGTADLAITKNNQVNSLGVQGTIFSLNLRAATVISSDVIFNLAITGSKAITKSGVELPLTANNYTIKFKASDATGLLSLDPENFSIFPNPASEIIKVRSSGAGKITRIDIYSIDGKTLKSEEFTSKESFDLNISFLEKGSYIFKLGLENGTTINKQFIKL